MIEAGKNPNALATAINSSCFYENIWGSWPCSFELFDPPAGKETSARLTHKNLASPNPASIHITFLHVGSVAAETYPSCLILVAHLAASPSRSLSIQSECGTARFQGGLNEVWKCPNLEPCQNWLTCRQNDLVAYVHQKPSSSSASPDTRKALSLGNYNIGVINMNSLLPFTQHIDHDS